MQCQVCKQNDATIHLTEISSGIRKELHVCELCAIEQGIIAKSQMSINELLGSLLSSAPKDEAIADLADIKTKCPRCSFTLNDFKKDALLGCPYDYDVFEKTLVPLIENAHNGKAYHCGKVPSKAPSDTKLQIKLLNLKKQLEEAVRIEDYEQAAALRDKITEAEKN